MGDGTLSHDEALLWLNDRLDRHALVSVHLEISNATPLLIAGPLRHWRQDNPPSLDSAIGDDEDSRDIDVSGLYQIGGDPVQLNVAGLGGAVSYDSGGIETLVFPLEFGLRLSVTVGSG